IVTFQPAPEPVASLTVDLPRLPVATWSAPVSVALRLAVPGDESVSAPPVMPVVVEITPAIELLTVASARTALATAASALFLIVIVVTVLPPSDLRRLSHRKIRSPYQFLNRGSPHRGPSGHLIP